MPGYGGDFSRRGRLHGAAADDRGYEAMAGFRGRLERGDPGYGGDYRRADGMRGAGGPRRYDRDFGRGYGGYGGYGRPGFGGGLRGYDRQGGFGQGGGFRQEGGFGGRGPMQGRGPGSGPSGPFRGQGGRPFRDAWSFEPETRRGPDFRGR